MGWLEIPREFFSFESLKLEARVGFEPKRLIENTQVIDFTKRREGHKGRNGGCLYNSVQKFCSRLVV
jgi:hypothetical protein